MSEYSELAEAIMNSNLPKPPKEESIDTPDTVVASILRGEYDSHIEQICRVAGQRRDDVRSHETFKKSISWKAGDRVEVIGGRPHYLVGSKGTITKVMNSWCLMKLDQGIGKFTTTMNIRSPMSILKKI